MSDILIKDMEMPTRCEDCPVCHYMERGTITVCGCKATMMIRPIDCNSKPYWCPLVEVPPHGRLIDFDAALDGLAHKVGLRSLDYLIPSERAIISWFKNAPTIIPAEEGK